MARTAHSGRSRACAPVARLRHRPDRARRAVPKTSPTHRDGANHPLRRSRDFLLALLAGGGLAALSYAILSRPDTAARRCLNVDPVIAQPRSINTKPGQHLALDRPGEQ